MIAVDSSTVILFLHGNKSREVDLLSVSLGTGEIMLPPVALTEILSDPRMPAEQRKAILDWGVLEVLEGYWIRAGDTRAKLLSLKVKPPLADTLIAQSCIDHGVALITSDSDFRPFAKHCGLKLA